MDKPSRPGYITVVTDAQGLPVPRGERTLTNQANGIEPPPVLFNLDKRKRDRFTLRKKKRK